MTEPHYPQTPNRRLCACVWRGFDGIGQREKGGYLYRCDGMPTQVGCGAEVIVTRRFARVGKKSSGWFVCYGLGDDDEPDEDVVLTFCPWCAVVVLTGGSTPDPRSPSTGNDQGGAS